MKLPKLESETIEFKESTSTLKDAIYSLSAMINKSNFGKVYFGIRDNGQIIGQQIGKDTLHDIEHNCHQHIDPHIVISLKRITIGKKTIIELIGKGNSTPYQAYGKYLIRFGTINRDIPSNVLKQMFQENQFEQWDTKQSKTTIKDIDNEWLKHFVNRMDDDKFKKLKSVEQLTKLDLYKKPYLNNAGCVLFSKNIKIPLIVAVFPGTTKIDIGNTRRKSGSFYDILSFCEDYLYNNTNYLTVMTGKFIGGRKEVPEIPVSATREAIINSLIHREYTSNIDNSLFIFKDRIEFYNPGSFNSRFNPIDYIKNQAIPICRNKLIAQTIYRVEDTETLGSGIKRIYDDCKKAGLNVEFIKEEEGFKVIIHRKINFKSINTVKKIDEIDIRERTILEYLFNNKTINRNETITLLNCSIATAKRMLSKLQKKHLIISEGKTNKTIYRLK